MVFSNYCLSLKGVLVARAIVKNLLSITKLTMDNDVLVKISNAHRLIRDKQTYQVVLRGMLGMACTCCKSVIKKLLSGV